MRISRNTEVTEMKRFALLLALIMTLNITACLADTQIGYINADTKIYMDASEKAIVDGNAVLGNQVRIEEERAAEGTGWYRVTFTANNKEGWVKADDVDLVIAKKAITADKSASAAPGGVQVVERENAFPVLEATGQIDPDTLPGAPTAADYRELNVGDSGDDVTAFVQRLYELGYVESKSAKKLTKTHQTAVKQFQKANGLEQDGLFTPELQAKVFSPKALNKKGKTLAPTDPLVISKGTVKADNKGGGTIQFTMKNMTGEKIDAFNIALRLYNTYGERFLLRSVADDATMNDELTVFDNLAEERYTIRKNESFQFGLKLGYYFAGVMVAVTAYHVDGGDTVVIPSDQRHWYGFGKGVAQDYQPLTVTLLTDLEKQQAANWKSGLDGIYVDGEIATAYGVREGYLVQKMEPGCMFDEAGLKMGDILLAVGDVRIFGAASIDRALSRLSAGESVTVLFFRNGMVYQTQLVAPGGAAAA